MRPWRVAYKTRDGAEHSCIVDAKNTVHAVNLAARVCLERGQRWLKALEAWPADETPPLPGLRGPAMEELGIKEG